MKNFFIVLFLAALIFLFWQISDSPSFQFFGEIIPRVQTTEKVVALTFDDGPSSKTMEVLQVLRENNIKATFFVIGKELAEYMEEGSLIAAAGHEIGNHTYSHTRMVFKSPPVVKYEIEKTDELIRKTGYDGNIYFRPPYGQKLFFLPYYLSEHNRKTITWSIEPDPLPQTTKSSDKIVEYVLKNVKPGSIILMHVMYNSRQESFNALPGIIAGLKAQGYSFKTVSELLHYQK